MAVERHPVRRVEPAGLIAGLERRETGQELAVGREELHAVVGAAHPDAPPLVDDDTDRSRQVLRPAAEAAGVGRVAAEGEQRLAFVRESLDAADPRLAALVRQIRELQ